MMKLNKTLYYLLCLMIGVYTLSGCIEEYEADISSDDSDLLVVEGTISPGLNKFILSSSEPLTLSQAMSFSSYTIRMVDGARVSVRGSDGSEYLAQSDPANDPFSYRTFTCQIDALAPDVDYYLHIEMPDGEIYESEPQKPLRTEKIADVCGVQNTPESNIDVLITPDEPFEPDKANYYSWTYDETWEVRPEYTTIIYFDTKKMEPVIKRGLFPERGWKDAKGTTIMVGASTSYEGQHIQRLKLYDINRSDERMYCRYSGLIHQRAISKAEYEYELARRQAGSEMGGLFTPQPSALPTNIHCLTSRKHVIGFVGCSLNTSKYRFFLDDTDFSIRYPQRKDTRIWLEDPSMEDCLIMVYRGMILCEWEDAIKSPDGKLHTAWAYDYQVDVRCNGAYIEEPDFWSLNENVSY